MLLSCIFRMEDPWDKVQIMLHKISSSSVASQVSKYFSMGSIMGGRLRARGHWETASD